MRLEKFFARFAPKGMSIDAVNIIKGTAMPGFGVDQAAGVAALVQHRRPLGYHLLHWLYTGELTSVEQSLAGVRALALELAKEADIHSEHPDRLGDALTAIALSELCRKPLSTQIRPLTNGWIRYGGLPDDLAARKAKLSTRCPRCTGTGRPLSGGVRRHHMECSSCKGYGYQAPTSRQRAELMTQQVPDLDTGRWARVGDHLIDDLMAQIGKEASAAAVDLQDQLRAELAA